MIELVGIATNCDFSRYIRRRRRLRSTWYEVLCCLLLTNEEARHNVILWRSQWVGKQTYLIGRNSFTAFVVVPSVGPVSTSTMNTARGSQRPTIATDIVEICYLSVVVTEVKYYLNRIVMRQRFAYESTFVRRTLG